MKRNVSIISVVLILLASACAPKGTPTANPVDIANTAQASALTMVAQTLAAVPTATPLPPTETPSPTLAPTNTLPPLPTQELVSPVPGLATSLPTNVSGVPGLPTFTPQSPSSSTNNNQDPCNQPLTSWQGDTATFTIANQTKPKGTIVLSMFVRTTMGQCGYLIVTGDSFSGPTGDYTAGAFISGKKNMKAFGSFRITPGNWKIIIKNDSIMPAGSCFPNC